MLTAKFAAVMVAVVMAVGGPRPCQGQWSVILPALTEQVASLWQNNSLDFLGYTCYYNQQMKFIRWEFYFDGDFSCPTWTSIRGTVRTQNRYKALSRTIEDFLNKVQAAGLITDEEARVWMQGHN